MLGKVRLVENAALRVFEKVLNGRVYSVKQQFFAVKHDFLPCVLPTDFGVNLSGAVLLVCQDDSVFQFFVLFKVKNTVLGCFEALKNELNSD